jgi:hypothetical protein
MPRRREQGIGKSFQVAFLEKGGGNPCRFVAVQDVSRLIQIARPTKRVLATLSQAFPVL